MCHHCRDSFLLADMLSSFGGDFLQICDQHDLDSPWAIGSIARLLETLEIEVKSSYELGKTYLGIRKLNGSYSRASARRHSALGKTQERLGEGTPQGGQRRDFHRHPLVQQEEPLVWQVGQLGVQAVLQELFHYLQDSQQFLGVQGHLHADPQMVDLLQSHVLSFGQHLRQKELIQKHRVQLHQFEHHDTGIHHYWPRDPELRIRQCPKIGDLRNYIHSGPRPSGHPETIQQRASLQFHPPMIEPLQTRLSVLGYHHHHQGVVHERQGQSLHGGQAERQQAPRRDFVSLMHRVDEVKNRQQWGDLQKQEVERLIQGDPSEKDKEIYGISLRCDAFPYLQNPSGDTNSVGPTAICSKSPVEWLSREKEETHKKKILQSSFSTSRSSAVINSTDTISGENLASLENKVEGGASALQTQNHQIPEKVRDVIDNNPIEREQSIREECLITSSAGEEFISPDKGGVGKDLNKMANRSLVDFGDLEEKLNISHLDKESQNMVRNIERKRTEGFARKGNRVGTYKQFIYDLPVKLDQPIMASRRYFDKEVIQAVSPAFQELLDENVICEAGESIKLVSNLLPVSKPSSEYALASKIDKKLQLAERKGQSRQRICLDEFLPTAPPLPLPKIAELKSQMKNKLFSVLDLSMMFYSIRMTERSKSFLCFYALEGNKIFTFRRLVMGLKVAPFIATRSMQLILNQRSFDDWI